jgi:hypothetical protein
MISEAIDHILRLAQPTEIDIDPERIEQQLVFLGGKYQMVTPNTVDVLPVASLDSIVRFCGLAGEGAVEGEFLHVSTDASVRVYGAPHELYKTREMFARCAVPPPTAITDLDSEHRSPGWMAADEMIPLVLTGIEDDENRKALLLVLGNVVDGAAATYTDDGITQQVATKRGVALKALTDLPSPIKLVPRANYPELYNLPQTYVLRAEGGDENSPPTFRLLRINDPTFLLLRRDSIVKYLEAKLPQIPVV